MLIEFFLTLELCLFPILFDVKKGPRFVRDSLNISWVAYEYYGVCTSSWIP